MFLHKGQKFLHKHSLTRYYAQGFDLALKIGRRFAGLAASEPLTGLGDAAVGAPIHPDQSQELVPGGGMGRELV